VLILLALGSAASAVVEKANQQQMGVFAGSRQGMRAWKQTQAAHCMVPSNSCSMHNLQNCQGDHA
jgi:hypothetical protein